MQQSMRCADRAGNTADAPTHRPAALTADRLTANSILHSDARLSGAVLREATVSDTTTATSRLLKFKPKTPCAPLKYGAFHGELWVLHHFIKRGETRKNLGIIAKMLLDKAEAELYFGRSWDTITEVWTTWTGEPLPRWIR
jgi:hypothetical protein